MQLSVERKPFLECLQLAVQVAEKNSAMEMLKHVHLAAMDQTLMLRATDLQTYYSERIGAKVAREGAACVLAVKLTELVSKLGADDVLLELKEDALHIRCGRGRYRLPVLPPEDFPKAWEPEKGQSVTLEGDKLADLLGRVYGVCYVGESRPAMECVLLEPRGEMLRAVATDGHRLAIAECKAQGAEALKADHAVLLPKASARALIRLASKHGELHLSLDSKVSRLFAQAGGALSGFALVGAEYPEYGVVLKDVWDYSPVLSRETLRAALDRVRTTGEKATKKTAATAMVIRLGSDEMELSCESPDLGKAVERLEVDYNGPEIVTAYDPGYLDQGLAVMKSESVSLLLPEETGGPHTTSRMLNLNGEADPGYQHVVMGVHIQGVTEVH